MLEVKFGDDPENDDELHRLFSWEIFFVYD